MLDQDEISDGDSMVRINVSRERSERAVGHTDADSRRMLKRIRHREKQNVHDRSPLPP